MKRFDARALHAALDAQRTERGGRLEVDGVLAMVGWLGKPVEAFVREDGA